MTFGMQYDIRMILLSYDNTTLYAVRSATVSYDDDTVKDERRLR